LLETPDRWKRGVRWLVVLVLVTGSFCAHHLTGARFDLYVVFLVPVLLATWLFGTAAGIFLTLLSCAGWLYSDLTLKESMPIGIYLINSASRLAVFLLLVWSINRIRVLAEERIHLVRTDELTGLGSRRAFMERGELEVSRAQRGQQPLTVMFIDLDDFKRINDKHGHDTGDEVLRAIGRAMYASIRTTDFAARLGGDEFAILFPETGGGAARDIAGKIRNAVAAALAPYRYRTTLSIGIATLLRPHPPFEAALHVADDLMYQVKNAGKNSMLQKEIQD
jgi:diguanylate cyclase (GGDEF)-like protein